MHVGVHTCEEINVQVSAICRLSLELSVRYWCQLHW